MNRGRALLGYVSSTLEGCGKRDRLSLLSGIAAAAADDDDN